MKIGFAIWLGFVTTVQLTGKAIWKPVNEVVFD